MSLPLSTGKYTGETPTGSRQRSLQSVTIIGTGLIGSSIALALRRAGFAGTILGIDRTPDAGSGALPRGAFNKIRGDRDLPNLDLQHADVIVLATPVLAIMDWMERLAPQLSDRTLLTDVGSTKLAIVEHARRLAYNEPGRARFLPGHPMAGKESAGAAFAEATLFANATWLFTPIAEQTTLEAAWRETVESFGARTRDLDPARHDELLAWVSHLPQFVSTALAAVLQGRVGEDPVLREEVAAIGGRALRETTRLGASPYSMWRDVALTNTAAVAETLRALEEEIAHLRENLRTPELREEFRQANRFRRGGDSQRS